MSKFTNLINWEESFMEGYITTQELEWEMGRIGSGLWFRVGKGFQFDVSVPWFLRWLFDPKDIRYRKASALHDAALNKGFDRVAAAALFSAGLKVRDDVGSFERLAMTLGVILWRWK